MKGAPHDTIDIQVSRMFQDEGLRTRFANQWKRSRRGDAKISSGNLPPIAATGYDWPSVLRF